jgi:leucyl aminopeptidase (aminopeptidase T)
LSLEKAAETVVKECLNISPQETFLVITDTEKEEIGRAIFNAGLKIGCEAILAVMKPRSRHGEEPPKPVAEMWLHSDVFVAPTKYSLTHTQARKNATARGARGATMPGITHEIFTQTMGIDYTMVKENCEKMRKALEGAKRVEVTSPLGTDITMSIEGREILVDNGILHDKGAFGNLPAGEVFVAPVEGTANGVIVSDGSIAGIGVLKNPVKIKVEEGYAVEITGEAEAEMLKRSLESAPPQYKKEAYNIAELGLGCNFGARVVGNILEDEKVYETIHIALGDNSTIGGKTVAGIHIDCLLTKPTLKVDGKEIVTNGKWQI